MIKAGTARIIDVSEYASPRDFERRSVTGREHRQPSTAEFPALT
jgi:hypothetical protein